MLCTCPPVNLTVSSSNTRVVLEMFVSTDRSLNVSVFSCCEVADADTDDVADACVLLRLAESRFTMNLITATIK